jgi:hypothetical protein
MNWQPIETAPKDGTEVDLWVPDDGRFTNCWFMDGIWLQTEDGNTYSTGGAPTHWMPLPQPPQATEVAP